MNKWLFIGDFNYYRQKVKIIGNKFNFQFFKLNLIIEFYSYFKLIFVINKIYIKLKGEIYYLKIGLKE